MFLLVLSGVVAATTTDLFSALSYDSKASADSVRSISSKLKDEINQGTYWGESALTYAIRYCNEDVVMAILENRYVDVNLGNSYDTTPLLAELGRDSDARVGVVKALIEKGADPNSGTSWGYPPLQYAAAYCDEEILYALLESPLIDINITDTYGKTVLLAELGRDSKARIGVVEALIDGGINPNMGTSWGYSPAEYAIAYCSEEIALRVLASKYIDVNLLDEYGKTPLLVALSQDSNCSVRIVQALINLNANPNIGQSWGLNAVDYAKRYCSTEVYNLVLQHTATYDPNKVPEGLEIDTSIYGTVQYGTQTIVLYKDGTYEIR